LSRPCLARRLEAQIAALGAVLEEGKARRHKHNMADLNKRNADRNFKVGRYMHPCL
jgi:hypothetical protein